MGQLEAPAKVRDAAPDLARIKTILRERGSRQPAIGREHERQGTADRHGGQRQDGQRPWSSPSSARCGTSVYGKIQRKTSKFVAHNENNEAKVGDTVAIAESRPLRRRKRWVVTRVVAKAPRSATGSVEREPEPKRPGA